jgi:transposase InsO family protein
MMMGFIDTMRSEGHAVLSICRVLREQGCQIAARTYRAWRGRHVAARTITDAHVLNVVRDTAWVDVVDATGRDRRTLAPEGLYGRRKMTALVRRTTIPAKDGIRAGDLLNRDFTAPRPDHTWVMDFTYCRTWAGWVYVAFIVDVFSQRIVCWRAQTTKHVELVMILLRMSLWERDRQGRPIQPQQASVATTG